jgi:hypothetical protein
VVPSRPAADRPALSLERGQPALVDARLGVHDLAGGVEAGAVDGRLRFDALVQHGAEHSDKRGA